MDIGVRCRIDGVEHFICHQYRAHRYCAAAKPLCDYNNVGLNLSPPRWKATIFRPADSRQYSSTISIVRMVARAQALPLSILHALAPPIPCTNSTTTPALVSLKQCSGNLILERDLCVLTPRPGNGARNCSAPTDSMRLSKAGRPHRSSKLTPTSRAMANFRLLRSLQPRYPK